MNETNKDINLNDKYNDELDRNLKDYLKDNKELENKKVKDKDYYMNLAKNLGVAEFYDCPDEYKVSLAYSNDYIEDLEKDLKCLRYDMEQKDKHIVMLVKEIAHLKDEISEREQSYCNLSYKKQILQEEADSMAITIETYQKVIDKLQENIDKYIDENNELRNKLLDEPTKEKMYFGNLKDIAKPAENKDPIKYPFKINKWIKYLESNKDGKILCGIMCDYQLGSDLKHIFIPEAWILFKYSKDNIIYTKILLLDNLGSVLIREYDDVEIYRLYINNERILDDYLDFLKETSKGGDKDGDR